MPRYIVPGYRGSGPQRTPPGVRQTPYGSVLPPIGEWGSYLMSLADRPELDLAPSPIALATGATGRTLTKAMRDALKNLRVLWHGGGDVGPAMVPRLRREGKHEFGSWQDELADLSTSFDPAVAFKHKARHAGAAYYYPISPADRFAMAITPEQVQRLSKYMAAPVEEIERLGTLQQFPRRIQEIDNALRRRGVTGVIHDPRDYMDIAEATLLSRPGGPSLTRLPAGKDPLEVYKELGLSSQQVEEGLAQLREAIKQYGRFESVDFDAPQEASYYLRYFTPGIERGWLVPQQEFLKSLQ